MGTRRARPEDVEAIVDVFIAARAGIAYLPAVPDDEQTRRILREVLVRDIEVWVAEHDERVVGFAALSQDELANLYLHPSAQGRGLGSELLEVAKRRRPRGFTFWVFQRNDGARRFYERHGCRLVRLTDGRDNMEREPDALYEWRPRWLIPNLWP